MFLRSAFVVEENQVRFLIALTWSADHYQQQCSHSLLLLCQCEMVVCVARRVVSFFLRLICSCACLFAVVVVAAAVAGCCPSLLFVVCALHSPCTLIVIRSEAEGVCGSGSLGGGCRVQLMRG